MTDGVEHELVAMIEVLADGQWHDVSQWSANPASIERFAELGLTLEMKQNEGWRLSSELDLQNLAAARTCYDRFEPHLPARIELKKLTASTNNDLMATASQATARPLFLMTEFQTAGRGRRGKQWIMPYGAGLMFSMQRRFECAPAGLASLSLLAGAALADALGKSGATGLGLKWPNDLVVTSPIGELRKLGGILVEVAALPGNGSCAVVGVGLNFRLTGANAPIDRPWLDLAELMPLPLGARSELTGRLMAALARVGEDIGDERSTGWIDTWRQYDALAGRAVVCTGSTTINGMAAGIGEDGALLVDVGGRVHRVSTGEVSVALRRDRAG